MSKGYLNMSQPSAHSYGLTVGHMMMVPAESAHNVLRVNRVYCI
ncbi:hypothetical protein [Pseudidiomarina sp.]|nr:hypothetical protein [Pseudidiomarina sp.]MDX1705156.1 hypothetical protein [Pseudidiomarina sp.]